jgi:hypothetical protein
MAVANLNGDAGFASFVEDIKSTFIACGSDF